MRKKRRIAMLLLLAVTASLINACQKSNNATPAAPAGTVNLYAHTYTIPAWSSDSHGWYTNLGVPEITVNNINSASVQVYFGLAGGNTWTALPTTVVASTNYFMEYSTAVGGVEIQWYYNSSFGGIGQDPNTFYGATSQFKVVVIPSSARRTNSGLDLKNYNAVKATFDLKD